MNVIRELVECERRRTGVYISEQIFDKGVLILRQNQFQNFSYFSVIVSRCCWKMLIVN